jgi:cysteinyl-tRNA synthetase
MTLRIFNTLTGTREPLSPLLPGRVKLYVCGPTVYDDPHLGHARSAVIYDVVARYLKARGCRVTLVRNLTDIDDKIVQKARRLRQDYRIIGHRYIYRYQTAMERLNVAAPDIEPRATAFIPEMLGLIGSLIQKGHAYPSGGDVYFAVDSFKGYGRLSGRGHRFQADGPRLPALKGKKHPADFALWKSAVPQEPSWPSPWGPGRPGWHIECSAMSAALLGDVFDIHGGGVDLIFPHHENEIAQSQCVFGAPPANCWMHHGLVNVNGQKISKSLDNSQKLTDLLETYPAGAVRLFLLSKLYRHPLEFSHRSMVAAVRSFIRLQRFFGLRGPGTDAPLETGKRPGGLWFRFCNAMDDDFNFPRALAVVFEGVRHINRLTGNRTQSQAMEKDGGLKQITAELGYMCMEILGLNLDPAAAETANLQWNPTSRISPASRQGTAPLEKGEHDESGLSFDVG